MDNRTQTGPDNIQREELSALHCPQVQINQILAENNEMNNQHDCIVFDPQ